MKRVLVSIVLLLCASEAFASFSGETLEVKYLSGAHEVHDKAVELGSVVDIYEYVRNNFEYTPYHGARSNSLTTLFASRGNDVDLATLTIALYRSLGIPARYVEGVAEVKSADLMAWLGVENRILAETIMLQQGILSTDSASQGEMPVYDAVKDTYALRHTWVEILVPVDNYRGIDVQGKGACVEEGNGCAWVGLDPSFKKIIFDTDAVNLHMDQVVPSEDFFQSLYDAEKDENPVFRGKNPLEVYEDKIQTYLESNYPGKSLDDVIDNGVIAADNSGLLPFSMPYKVTSVTRRFGSIAERDASLLETEYPFKKTVTLSMVYSETGATMLDGLELPLSEIADSRVIVTFENCVSGYCDVRVRKDGVILATVPFSSAGMELFDLVKLTVTADESSPFYEKMAAVYPTTYIGGMYAIASGGYGSSWSLVHRAIDRLLAAHQQYPTQVTPDNTVYIDDNQNGQFDEGEALDGNKEALDALSGGFLDVAVKLYFAKFYDAYEELKGIHKVNMPISAFIGVASTKADVNYIDGSAFLVNPKGLLIDLKGMTFGGSWMRDKENIYYNDHVELLAHISSSLEHEVWQELTGFDAISTVRGFQWIRQAGTQLVASGSDTTANLDRVDCYRVTDVILQLLGGVTNPATNQPFASMPINITWQTFHDLYADYYQADPDGTPKVNLAAMLAFVSNGTISHSSFVNSLPLCNGTAVSGSFQNMREQLFQNAKNFSQGGTIPPRKNYKFGSIGTYILSPAYLSAVVSEDIRAAYASAQQWYKFQALTPVVANSIDGNSYSVYMKKQLVSELPDGQPVSGNPIIASIQMGLSDSTLTSDAGGGLVLFPVTYDWYENSVTCGAASTLCGGYLDGVLDPTLFGQQYSLDFTFNDLLKTPSTADPINTVTGNLYHDEQDIHLPSRGLDYTFTRTYNSKESLGDANWDFPFSQGWTHSYNVRLVDSDGIKFIDERGAAYKYDVVAGAAFSGVQEISALSLTSDLGKTYVIEMLGDVNGDQHGDAAYIERSDGSTTSAYTYVAFFLEGNGDGTYQPPVQVASYQGSQSFAVIVPFGDINKDGYNDVLFRVGSEAALYLGSPSGLVASSLEFPPAKYAYAGDLNGDGYKDLARFQTSGSYQGLAIYYGSASGFDMAAPQTIMSSLQSYSGEYDTVLTAMDINNDGYDDLIVDIEQSGTKLARVYLGSATGLATQPATSDIFSDGMTGFPEYSYVVGDLDGDTYPDVVSRVLQGGPALDVYLNSSSGFSAARKLRINLEGELGTGWVINPLGDQNGDGFAEFGTARVEKDATGNNVTYYSIYSGNPAGVQATPMWEFAVAGTYASVLSGSAYSFPVYLSGVAKGLLLLTPSELRTVSLQNAQVVDISNVAKCEKEVVANWQGTGKYMLPFCNGTHYVFSPMSARHGETSARLEMIQDPYGNEQVLGYDAEDRLATVTDNTAVAGRTGLQFSYYDSGEAAGKLKSIQDWSGRVWTYEYDNNGRLDAAIPPAGPAWQTRYTYEGDTHLLHEVIKPENRDGKQNVVTFEYYKNGRAYRYTNAVGDAEVVDYDIFSTSSQITQPGGGIMVHDYDDAGQLDKLVNPDGGVNRYANSVDHKRYSKKNPLGYETTYSYHQDRSISASESDTGGLVTREKDALGNTVDYDYGIHSQITRTKDKRGNERHFIYYDVTDAAAGKVAGKLYQIRATINGVQDVLLEEDTYFAHGGIKQKVEYIDQADSTHQRITDFTYTNNGLNVETITVHGATDAAAYGNTAVTSETLFTYDALGRVQTKTVKRRTSATDATLLNLVTSYEYDLFDRVTQETDPAGNITETVYDKNGKVYQVKLHHKQADGSYTVHTQVTNYYDAYDRLIRTVDIDSGETHYTYGPTVFAGKSDLLAVTDANGNTVRNEYDAMHHRTATIDGNGRRTEYQYDKAGNLIKVTNPVGQSVSYKYDPLGRQTQAITNTGKVIELRYDANGNVTHILDANAYANPAARNAFGASIYREYDEFNRLVREVNAEGGETHYTYDLLGNMISLADAKGQVTTFVHDDMGLLRKVIDPLVESPTDLVTTFTYDEAGNRLTVIDRKGSVTRFTYDLLNRLVKTSYLTDGTEDVYVYDALGNLASVSNGAVTYSYTYDAKHRVTSRTDDRLGLSLAWNYDAAGNIHTKTDYQGSVTTYQYDGSNRLIATSNPDYVHARYAYDGAGRLLSRTLSNGARTTYAYNSDGWLAALTNIAANGQVVQQQSMTYDAAGNITSINDGSNTVTYTHDKVYRLTGADYPGTANDLLYGYDPVGNRTSTTHAGVTTYYHYAAGNRLLGQYQDAAFTQPVKTYQYDANGNRTQVTDAGSSPLQSLTFDQRGFVSSLSTPASGYTFAYDPLGYRIKRATSGQTNLYMLEGEHLEAIYNPIGELQSSYFRGSLVDEIVNGFRYVGSTKTNFTVHHDHLNSVMALTDHNGQAWQHYEYDPFGQPLASAAPQVPNDFTYTGREWDSRSGLYYYRARYYDPEVGRFISEDPLGFKAGVNFYAYVNNQPLMFSDPMGLVRWGDALGSGLGMMSSGAGMFVGGAMAVGGGGLLAVPEPVLTKVAGIAAVSFGTGLVAKSSFDFSLNAQNFLSAVMDSQRQVPSSLFELGSATFYPGSKDAQLLAVAGNLTVDLASGRVPMSMIPDMASLGSVLHTTKIVGISDFNDYQAVAKSAANAPVEIGYYGTSLLTESLNLLQGGTVGQVMWQNSGTLLSRFTSTSDSPVYANNHNGIMVQKIYGEKW